MSLEDRKKRSRSRIKPRPEFGAGGLPAFMADYARNAKEMGTDVASFGANQSLRLLNPEERKTALPNYLKSYFGWPAFAPADILGSVIDAFPTPHNVGGPPEQTAIMPRDEPVLSGDPTRRAMGIDPDDPMSIAGEVSAFAPIYIRGMERLQKLYRGIRTKPEKVTLYHFSPKNDIEVLDPKFYGTGVKGAEAKRREQFPEYWVDRTHYYTDPAKREVGVGANQYEVQLNLEDLYPINEDPLKLFAKLPDDWVSAQRINAVEKQIHGLGFKGSINTDNGGVILFDSVTPFNVGVAEQKITAAARRTGVQDIVPEDLPFKVNVTDEFLQETGMPGVRKPVDGKPSIVIGSPNNDKFPTGMNRRQVRALRRNLLKELDSSGGSIGRYWYEEVSDFIKKLTGGRENARQAAARLGAETSRRTEISANASALDRAWNQMLMDDPVLAGSFPRETAKLAKRMQAGEDVTGGPKIEPFRVSMLLEAPGAPRPTNDIIMARLFGFAVKDTKTGTWRIMDGGLTEAQHKFMDWEMRRMTEMANKQNIGGFNDWTEERLQAAMWVMSKAKEQGMSVAEAAKHFRDSLHRRTANIRTEGVTPVDPITGERHLANVAGRESYLRAHEDVTGTVPQGITGASAESTSGVSQNIGGLTQPPVHGPGSYAGEVGQPSVSTPIMAGATTTESGLNAIHPSSDLTTRLTAIGKGLPGGQEVAGITFLRPEARPNMRNAAYINLGRVISPEEMNRIQGKFNEFFNGDVAVMHSKQGAEAIDLFELSDLSDDWFRNAVKLVNRERKASAPKLQRGVTETEKQFEKRVKKSQPPELKPRKNETDEKWKMRVRREVYEHVIKTQAGVDAAHARNTGAGLVGNDPWSRKKNKQPIITPAQRRFAEAEGLDPEQAFPGGSGFTPSEYLREYDEIVEQISLRSGGNDPDVLRRFDHGLREETVRRMALDENIIRDIPDAGVRAEVLERTRKVIIKDGMEGVRKAVQSGFLPGVILGALSLQLSQGQPSSATRPALSQSLGNELGSL